MHVLLLFFVYTHVVSRRVVALFPHQAQGAGAQSTVTGAFGPCRGCGSGLAAFFPSPAAFAVAPPSPAPPPRRQMDGDTADSDSAAQFDADFDVASLIDGLAVPPEEPAPESRSRAYWSGKGPPEVEPAKQIWDLFKKLGFASTFRGKTLTMRYGSDCSGGEAPLQALASIKREAEKHGCTIEWSTRALWLPGSSCV